MVHYIRAEMHKHDRDLCRFEEPKEYAEQVICPVDWAIDKLSSRLLLYTSRADRLVIADCLVIVHLPSRCLVIVHLPGSPDGAKGFQKMEMIAAKAKAGPKGKGFEYFRPVAMTPNRVPMKMAIAPT
jgi:hypothetical protein